MKLLILTQIVDKNDAVLGFFHEWIKEFAKQCNKVTVICLYKGKYDLPDNVQVLGLGKEKGADRIDYIFNFYKYIWQQRNNYNRVFVHMNPEYAVLGGLPWWFLGKKIGLWYAHRSVNLKLRLAEKFSDKIFTSTEKGFRLKSKKVKVVGQGIDTELFVPAIDKLQTEKFEIINTGRISPSKDYETLIGAMKLLAADPQIPDFELKILGGAGLKRDEKYLKKLKEIVKKENLGTKIKFLGPKTPYEVVKYLQSAQLFVSATRTGSLDKAVLEAMSCALPIVSSCESLADVLNDEQQERFMFPLGNSYELYNKTKSLMKMSKEQLKNTGRILRKIVTNSHSIKSLITKILS